MNADSELGGYQVAL